MQQTTMTIADKKFFVACAAFYLVLAALLWASTPTPHSCFDIDSTGYDALAQQFAATGSLLDTQVPARPPVQTLGYPWFVGMVYSIVGHSWSAVIWLQIGFMVLALWLLFRLAYMLFGCVVARVALVLAVLNVGFLVYPQFLLAESLVVLLLLICIERFFYFYQSGKYVPLAISCSVLGLSLLVKPAALLFVGALWAIAVVRVVGVRARLLVTAIFLAAVGGPLVAYFVRNKLVYDFFGLAPMTYLNMYHVFLAKVIAHVHGISETEAMSKVPPCSGFNTLDPAVWSAAREHFYYYMSHYPFTCLVVWVQNVVKSTLGLFSTQLKLLMNPTLRGGDISFFASAGCGFGAFYSYIVGGAHAWWMVAIALAEAVWTPLRWLLVLCGVSLLCLRRRWMPFFFFALFVLNGLIITGFDGCARYRIIVEPLLIVLAAYTLVYLYNNVRYYMRAGILC